MQVRRTITEFLDSKGLFRGTADNKMSLGLCSRSKDVIEPLMRPQWWVDCKQMAAASCDAVRTGDLQILPAECETTWFRRVQPAFRTVQCTFHTERGCKGAAPDCGPEHPRTGGNRWRSIMVGGIAYQSQHRILPQFYSQPAMRACSGLGHA